MTDLPLKSIRPPKAKLRDDVGDLESLKRSMKSKGLLEPILVRQVKEHFEVIAGHRRYLSAIELGWEEISVTVMTDVTDKDAMEIALAENIERKTMDVIEEAQVFHRYTSTLGYGSISELAPRINRTVQYISARLSLLKLGKEAFEGVRTGKMTTSHGEVLATLTADQSDELTRRITSESTGKPYIDVEQTRRAVSMIKRGAGVDQAVELALEHPEWDMTKEHSRFDPIKTARDTMVILLEKALVETDSNINRLPDGEEKARWIHDIRYPLHELGNKAIKLVKSYGK